MLTERMEQKIDRSGEDGCWVWTGARTPRGYGQVGVGSRTDGTRAVRGAHRVVYEALVGPIPEGLEIDHLCRNTGCVNPDHLEPVSHRENLLRGEGPPGQNARKTHCKHGHEFTPENTLPYLGKTPGRQCLTCRQDWERTRRKK